MQTKTFTAPSIGDAMELVRLEFGSEAVIVSTRRDDDGVEVTATLDVDETASDEDSIKVPWLRKRHAQPDAVLDPSDRARQALFFHGVADPLAQRLIRAVSARYAEMDPMGDGRNRGSNEAFYDVIAEAFTFEILDDLSRQPTMLIGPAGSGKTVTVAKLAARHTLHKGGAPGLMTADVQRAGGVEQLEGFARILETDLKVVASPGGAADTITKTWDRNGLFIDTPATNPFSSSDMTFLSDMIEATNAKPILVLAQGGDASEVADVASAFAGIGAKGLIVTRTDAQRRQGTVLTAADAGGLPLFGAGIAAQIAEGLMPMTPRQLAGMILPNPNEAEKHARHGKAGIEKP